MTDETQTTEAPKRTRKAKAVEADNTTIFKPHGEEFTLDGDFTAIAVALNLQIDAIEWTIEESAEGKTLSGKPKA